MHYVLECVVGTLAAVGLICILKAVYDIIMATYTRAEGSATLVLKGDGSLPESERLLLAAAAGAPLYDEDVVEHAAITEMAERVVSLGPLAGLAAYDIDNDYYDVERNYPLLSDAIQLLNPSK